LAFYSDQELPANRKVDLRLLELIGKPQPKIGYIPSASDSERFWYNQKQRYYAEIGAVLTTYFELDIDYQPEKLSELLACDAIHLSGGNTYHFLYWQQRRGMLEPLRAYVENGGVLIGVSAGAILMTPEISSTDFCMDAPLPSEENHDLSALGLVDFAFFPHINDNPQAEKLMQGYSRTHEHVLYGCHDGNGIIVDGDRLEFFGNIQKAENGETSNIITFAR
jgi:dipeptidase E